VRYDAKYTFVTKIMLFLSKKAQADKEAQEYLWRAQCNCAYWHGVFGGLYLGHLRRAIYENLIKAQICLAKNAVDNIQLLELDIDKDGSDEILIQTPSLSLSLEPHRGGGLFEICHLPRALNLSDTLTRRPEVYHHQLNDISDHGNHGKEDGIASIHDIINPEDQNLNQFLVFDSYTRASLLDHFLGSKTTIEDYAKNDYSELGDFVQGHYVVDETLSSPGKALVRLSRTGVVNSCNMTITKTVRLGEGPRLWIDYEFECHGPDALSTLYGCEYNMTLYSDTDPERYYFAPESGIRREISETGTENNIKQFELVNRPDRLNAVFRFYRPLSVWFYPLMTVSKSEKGFDRTYQGSSILFVLPLALEPGKKACFQTELEFVDLWISP